MNGRGNSGARRRLIAAAVVAATTLAACAGASGSVIAARTRAHDRTSSEPAAAAGWTVLHYSMADTDLEPFMMADVNEMGTVGSDANLNIVALVDRSAEYGDEPALDVGDWVGAKVLQVLPGDTSVELADLGPTDMGDPTTLSTFITYGITNFPADHYALIISDHGAAWPGVGPDESAGESVLDLPEIQQALETGLTDAGVVERLDLLGFDACLMSAYEVASALAPYADRMVASSETEPGSGWDYSVLGMLAADPSTSVDDFGVAIVDSFIANSTPDSTLAVLDLAQMPALDEAMAAFTSALVERTATVAPDVGRTLAGNPGYGRSPDPTEDHYMTDLGTLTAAIGVEALDVSDQADAVLRALNDVVVYRSSGPQAPSFSGLSIYFPPSADYSNGAYVDAAPNPSGWVGFLESYYAAGQGIDATEQPTFLDAEPNVAGDATGVTVEGTVDTAAIENLASGTLSYGVQLDDGSTVYYGDETATIDEAGLVSSFYDLSVLTISDGSEMATAYASATTDHETDGYGLDVPMAYYAPGWVEGDPYDDVTLSIAVDGDGNVIHETFYAVDPDTGATGELYTEPGGTIVPEVPIVDADGNQTWAPTSDVGLVADLPSLAYEFAPLDPGTSLVLFLEVTDFGNNSTAISTVVAVP